MSRRTNQGGSVVAYIIIGVLLVAALASGVYLARWRSSQVAKQVTESRQGESDNGAAKPEKKKESTPKPEVGATKPATTDVKADNNDVSENPVLPATGVETGISSYLGLFVLIFTANSYVNSRNRNCRRL